MVAWEYENMIFGVDCFLKNAFKALQEINFLKLYVYTQQDGNIIFAVVHFQKA